MTWSNRNQNNTTNYQHPNESNLWELHKAMGYDPQGNPIIRIDDTSLQHTSKDRAKVSGYEIVFFNTFQFDKEDDVWDEFTTAGGTSTHDPNARECHLIVDGSIPGAKVIRQTKNVQRYIPGRTTEASFAVVFGHNEDPGIVKRFGVYDENNGLFVEVIGNTIALVIRSDANGSIVEKRIPQAEWNQDVLNGTGRTGITLNLAMRQIILFEYEWYGAGVAELKFVIDDHAVSAHKEYHANRQELPWTGTPFVPLRCEIENVSSTSGSHHLHQGSNSVLLEGETSKLGIAASVGSPITGTTMQSANTWYPILSIRLNPERLNGIVLPSFFQVATIDNTNLFYRLVRNATIGADAGNSAWTVVPDSGSTFTEFQTYNTPAAIAEVNQGSRLDTGFIVSGGGGAGVRLDRDTVYQLGRSNLGTTSDVFTILVASSGANKSAIASMTWTEQR